MTVKRGRFGELPRVHALPGVQDDQADLARREVPAEGCGGFIAEKRSRRGKPFYGCSNWAKKQCDFVAWDLPIAESCPSCGAAFLVKKELRSGASIRCVKEGCGYARREGLADEVDPAEDIAPA
jgi:DNA topoisomerase I